MPDSAVSGHGCVEREPAPTAAVLTPHHAPTEAEAEVRIFSPALPAAFALASTVRDGTIGPHNDDASNVPPGGNVHGYAPGASVIAAHKNISLTSAAAGDAAYLVASDDASTTGVLVEGASGSLLRCRFGLAGHTSGRLVTARSTDVLRPAATRVELACTAPVCMRVECQGTVEVTVAMNGIDYTRFQPPALFQ